MTNKSLQKTWIQSLFLAALFLGSFTLTAQEGSEGSGHEGRENGEHTRMMRKAHQRDYKKGKGEEDGSRLRKTEVYNVTKRGVELVLKYNKRTNAFQGYMKNITRKVIKRARVEIHLSNGIELGPTKPVNLGTNERRSLSIKASHKAFKTWNAHAEIGNSEHSGSGGRGEGHGKEGRGEHGGRNGGE